ncbi:hypothetical protein L1987_72617 [Smallanthus sonchifolius]|uniref:Uncharacterized protein n=1 Tax=Smallanthus sonchifolius TaxID=185202 RepID=A0ACB9AW03_9ASTR|nr:hypothetical protein L1987_72617 [Smallanthus sonchifolius]
MVLRGFFFCMMMLCSDFVEFGNKFVCLQITFDWLGIKLDHIKSQGFHGSNSKENKHSDLGVSCIKL